MIYPQGGIRIHCIPTRVHFHHGIPTRGICIMACTNGTFASWHTPKRTFASWHTTKETFASWHTHKGAFTSWHTYMNIYIMTYIHEHLHYDTSTRSICIMTYPLEGICIARHLHLHLCKGTFASRLNMCASTIMDKLCICIPAWDICIIWTFHICILVKSICIRNGKSRLASHFVCVHKKLTSRSVFKSLSIACRGIMVA